MLKLSSSEIALEVLKSRRNISGQLGLQSSVFGKSSEIFGTVGTFFSKSRSWLNENLTHLSRKKLAGIFLPWHSKTLESGFDEPIHWFRLDRGSTRVKKYEFSKIYGFERKGPYLHNTRIAVAFARWNFYCSWAWKQLDAHKRRELGLPHKKFKQKTLPKKSQPSKATYVEITTDNIWKRCLRIRLQ